MTGSDAFRSMADDSRTDAAMSTRRRFIQTASMAGLGLTLPTFPTSAAAPPKPDAFDGPVGVHHAFGPVPSTDLNVGFSGGAAAVARVEYSPDESLTQTATAEPLPLPGEELVTYRAALRELTPGETYHVQAFLDGERSPIFEVSTAPADATSFTVTAWGDHGVEDPRNDYKRGSERRRPTANSPPRSIPTSISVSATSPTPTATPTPGTATSTPTSRSSGTPSR